MSTVTEFVALSTAEPRHSPSLDRWETAPPPPGWRRTLQVCDSKERESRACRGYLHSYYKKVTKPLEHFGMEGRLWREGWCWTCPAAGGTLQKRAAGRNTRAGVNLITVGVSLQSEHTPYQQRALWRRFLCRSWDDSLSQRFSNLNVSMATWNRAPLSYKHARFLVALRFVGLNQWLKTSWICHLRSL